MLYSKEALQATKHKLSTIGFENFSDPKEPAINFLRIGAALYLLV